MNFRFGENRWVYKILTNCSRKTWFYDSFRRERKCCVVLFLRNYVDTSEQQIRRGLVYLSFSRYTVFLPVFFCFLFFSFYQCVREIECLLSTLDFLIITYANNSVCALLLHVLLLLLSILFLIIILSLFKRYTRIRQWVITPPLNQAGFGATSFKQNEIARKNSFWLKLSMHWNLDFIEKPLQNTQSIKQHLGWKFHMNILPGFALSFRLIIFNFLHD